MFLRVTMAEVCVEVWKEVGGRFGRRAHVAAAQWAHLRCRRWLSLGSLSSLFRTNLLGGLNGWGEADLGFSVEKGSKALYLA